MNPNFRQFVPGPITPPIADELNRLAREVERLAKINGVHPIQVSRESGVQIRFDHPLSDLVRVTSTTTVDGRYPAKLLSFDAENGTYTDADNIWAVELNGNDLAAQRYHSHEGEFANGRKVYVATQPETGGATYGAFALIERINWISGYSSGKLQSLTDSGYTDLTGSEEIFVVSHIFGPQVGNRYPVVPTGVNLTSYDPDFIDEYTKPSYLIQSLIDQKGTVVAGAVPKPILSYEETGQITDSPIAIDNHTASPSWATLRQCMFKLPTRSLYRASWDAGPKAIATATSVDPFVIDTNHTIVVVTEAGGDGKEIDSLEIDNQDSSQTISGVMLLIQSLNGSGYSFTLKHNSTPTAPGIAIWNPAGVDILMENGDWCLLWGCDERNPTTGPATGSTAKYWQVVASSQQLKSPTQEGLSTTSGDVALGDNSGSDIIIGGGTSDAVAFFGGTGITQPSSADQTALTAGIGSASDATLATVGDTSTGDESTAINDNFEKVAELLNELRSALVNFNLIKGGS